MRDLFRIIITDTPTYVYVNHKRLTVTYQIVDKLHIAHTAE
jgi:hypothetical protein